MLSRQLALSSPSGSFSPAWLSGTRLPQGTFCFKMFLILTARLECFLWVFPVVGTHLWEGGQGGAFVFTEVIFLSIFWD